MVQPSRIEAMPMAVLEAMAAGKAIVASGVGDIPRLLEDGNAGVLVPPAQPELLADAILNLLRDSSRRRRIETRAAQKALEQFDVSIMASEYIHMYQSTIARQRQKGRTLRTRRAGVEV